MLLSREDYDRLYHGLTAAGVPGDELEAAMPHACPPDSYAVGTPGNFFCGHLSPCADGQGAKWVEIQLPAPSRSHERSNPSRPTRKPPGPTHYLLTDGTLVPIGDGVTPPQGAKTGRLTLLRQTPSGGWADETGPVKPAFCVRDGKLVSLIARDDSWWYGSPWSLEQVAIPEPMTDVAAEYLKYKAQIEELRKDQEAKLQTLKDVLESSAEVDRLKVQLTAEEGADAFAGSVDEIKALADEIAAHLGPLRDRAASLRAEAMTPTTAHGHGLGGIGSWVSDTVRRATREAKRTVEHISDPVGLAKKVGARIDQIRRHYQYEYTKANTDILREYARVGARLALEANRSEVLAAFHEQDVKFVTAAAAMLQRNKQDQEEFRLKVAQIQARHKGQEWIVVIRAVHAAIKQIVLNTVIPGGALISLLGGLAETALDVEEAKKTKEAIKDHMKRAAAAEEAALQREIADLERQIAEARAKVDARKASAMAQAQAASPTHAAAQPTAPHPTGGGISWWWAVLLLL